MTYSPKLNLLVAFPYMTEHIIRVVRELGTEVRLLVDSGAFTAWKGGKAIALDDYCRFLERLGDLAWRYFVLDVVGDPEATLQNYETMRARGFKPVPIYTRGDALERLDHYFESSDLVALGGLVGGGQRALAHIKAVHEHAAGRHLHTLGFTSVNWLKHLRPYSADSSNWEAGGRYGVTMVHLGHGRITSYSKTDAMTHAPGREMCQAIGRLGFDPYDLQYKANWHGDNSISRWIAAAAWVDFSGEIERATGVKLFVALSADRADMLRDCFYATQGRADLAQCRLKIMGAV